MVELSMAAAAGLPFCAALLPLPLPLPLPPPHPASASAASDSPATVMLVRLMISPSLLTEPVSDGGCTDERRGRIAARGRFLRSAADSSDLRAIFPVWVQSLRPSRTYT